jgi:ketosteroid isomerase-like protein
MSTRAEQAALEFADAINGGNRRVALEVCHPEIEFDSMLGIGGRTYLGHDGIREYFDDIESAWDRWKVEVERTVEGPDGRVAIVMTMHARGQGSGLTLAERTAHIWTLKEGRLVGNQLYRYPEDALRELGIKDA